MDWHWWIEAKRGMPLLVAMIASFTSVIIAIGSQIVSARNTRKVMHAQIAAQDQSRWSETKYTMFVRIVGDIDAGLDYLEDLQTFYRRRDRKISANPPTIGPRQRDAFAMFDSVSGEIHLLSPNIQEHIRNVGHTMSRAFEISSAGDETALAGRVAEAEFAYTKLLSAMRAELGLDNGTVWLGRNWIAVGKATRLDRWRNKLRVAKGRLKKTIKK
jgi:hypothetical protein